MGLKKYEIITVGSGKRVRALRSWAVGDRYVNIGDVGGIVYDEKTLSQDGACWLFRGNFGFPGARIGGDSIVDVGEAAPDVTGSSNLDILGTSAVVGAPVKFTVGLGAITLTAADFEQGTISYAAGTNWETWKTSSSNYLRTKAPIFMGGAVTTLKLDVPGYIVQAYALDRDGIGLTATASTNTGEGVTLTIPAGQYMVIRLAKNPGAGIVPADATAAQIKFTGTYETKLSIIDSRVEINPATSTGVTTIVPGGVYTVAPGAKYPDSIIQGSKVVINATSNKSVRFISDLSNVNATIDATTANVQVAGIYHGVYNLAFTGTVTSNWNEAARSLIQAYNCDNMVVSTTNFPGLAAMQTAGVPIKFYNCNLNNGRFYHHAQIANTYRDINFDLATKDLGKLTVNGYIMASSEVNGMYRLIGGSGIVGSALVESHESIKSLSIAGGTATYNTTIYADAYFNGAFELKGTNVFGNKVRSHPMVQVLNVQPRAVQGGFSLTAGQPPVPSTDSTRVRTEKYFRLNGASGIGVQNIPAGVEGRLVYLDGSGKYTGLGDWYTGSVVVPTISLVSSYAYILFRKTGDAAITPEDLAGATITVYNGCKIVNTGATAATIAGNVRVEDNATLIDTSVTGTGYFGGNSIAQGLTVEGVVYMKDNAVFAPTISGTPKANILHMMDNASFTGAWTGAGTRLVMSGNTRFDSATNHNTLGTVEMRDNASVSGSGSVSVSGVLVLEDDASIAGGNASISGDITLCGKYKQTAAKTWTGKRVIASQDAPTYDNNVKTKYDF